MTHDDAYTSTPYMAMQAPSDWQARVDQLAKVAAERDREAARADQNATLVEYLIHGEVARLMAERHWALSKADAHLSELDRMRPLVEAAAAWADWWPRFHSRDWARPEDLAVMLAVDAYRSTLGQDGTARPPQEAQDGPEAAGGTAHRMTPAETLQAAADKLDALPERWRHRITVTEAGCWTWDVLTGRGYGKATYQGRDMNAHRAVWLAVIGPLDDDQPLDHLCRNRACVRPIHMEPVTYSENIRRGHAARGVYDDCPRGHGPKTLDDRGRVRCKPCRADQARARRERLRGTEPPVHGTAASYHNYACRCALCREAVRVGNRMRLDLARAILGGES